VNRTEPEVTETTRETRILQSVVAVVDNLLDDFDVVDLLTGVTERCAELLDVTSAGVLLADPHRQLHLMAATSEERAAIWSYCSCRRRKGHAWTATPAALRSR